MWIKICANTNLEDAKLAAELGADAVGFVFAPSKRQVTTEQVAAIIPHLPASIERIGVFATRDAEEISAIVRATRLTGVQLHGGFDLALVRRLRAELGDDAAIIQTLHWVVESATNSSGKIAAQLREIAQEAAIDRVLMDSETTKARGGTGISFDWNAARQTLANVGSIKLIVAGGLRPANVAEAISAFDPWGVDVASGVESEPGRKDPEKLRRFVESARLSQVEFVSSHPSR